MTLKEQRDLSGSFSISTGAQNIPRTTSDALTVPVSPANSDAHIHASSNANVPLVVEHEDALTEKDTVNVDDAGISHEDSIFNMP